MIWYVIIMNIIFGYNIERAKFTYELTGDWIQYDMHNQDDMYWSKGQLPIPGTAHYEALLGIGEFDQGSGLGIKPHIYLGPRDGSGTVSPPTPYNPRKPPTNDGENGNPVIVSPDPGTPPPPPPPDPGTNGTCSTIGAYDDYYFGVTNYIIDAVGVGSMTSSRRAKFVIAKDMLKRGILTTHFKNDILSETYCNTTMTTAQVWARICSGRENWRPVTDNEVDAYQSAYSGGQGVVGSVASVNADEIRTNTYYIDQYDPSTLAGHVMHEWTHLLGFSHSGGSSSCGNEGDVSYEAGAFFGGNMESLDDDYGW